MKLDWSLIRKILEQVEKHSDGFSSDLILRHGFEEKNKGEEFMALAYHYKILFKAGLVEGSIMTASIVPSQDAPQQITYKGLTLEGHKVLEAMRNDTVWNKIKGSAVKMGIAGLEQIPALALAKITGA